MSWQAYVDTNLVGTGKVNMACILGLAGGVWATSSGFALAQAEQDSILGGLKTPDTVQASGVTLAGVKYFTLQADKGSHIYGKKGQDGCVIVQTTQAVLVAVYKPPTQTTECTTVVEGLATYLKSVGY